MTPSSLARHHVAWMTLVLALTPLPASAARAEANAAPNLAPLVAPGDTVTVTLWSGGRVSGVVVDSTSCALVLRTWERTWALQLPAIKTLRRHQRRQDSPASEFVLDAARQCNQLDCLPAAFVLIGIGAVIQGVDNLAHSPRVVYRAKRRLPTVGACPGQATTEPGGHEHVGELTPRPGADDVFPSVVTK